MREIVFKSAVGFLTCPGVSSLTTSEKIIRRISTGIDERLAMVVSLIAVEIGCVFAGRVE